VAGTIASAKTEHRGRGVVKYTAKVTCDASGVATAAVVGVGFGRLVAVDVVPGDVPATLNAATLNVTDGLDAPVLALAGTNLVATADKFGNTTTGDTTGGTAEDLWTTGAAHGLSEGDCIIFTVITGGGGGAAINTPYWVTKTTGFAATTFCLSDTKAHALASTNVVNVGGADVSASTWYNPAKVTAKHFRPTQVIGTNVGANVSADPVSPNVNRDIVLGGKFKLGVTGGGNLGTYTLHFTIDESGIGYPAMTV
jgi:hypothetical protein